MNSFAFDCPPRSMYADIVKGGIGLKRTCRRLTGILVPSEMDESVRRQR